MNGHRDLEIKLFSTSPPATNSDRRSFFADKSESAVNGCIASKDHKVNSAVNNNNNRVESSVKQDGKNSEDVSDTGCSSAFVAGEPSRNICDLALVTAWDTRVRVALCDMLSGTLVLSSSPGGSTLAIWAGLKLSQRGMHGASHQDPLKIEISESVSCRFYN